MFFEVKQIQKELFTADFSVNKKDTVIGQMRIEGKLGSMEGKWKGSAFGKEFTLNYGKGNINVESKNVFRPYSVMLEDGIQGCIYQTEQKDGLFSKMEYHQLILDGIKYNVYPIGFGKEGSKSPVYIGDEQIALIEKDCVVYDELHHYQVTATDEASALIALIFVCYMYTNACFNPGVKVIQSVSKTVSVTTNKKLKQKYDPMFKESVGE